MARAIVFAFTNHVIPLHNWVDFVYSMGVFMNRFLIDSGLRLYVE